MKGVASQKMAVKITLMVPRKINNPQTLCRRKRSWGEPVGDEIELGNRNSALFVEGAERVGMGSLANLSTSSKAEKTSEIRLPCQFLEKSWYWEGVGKGIEWDWT